MGKKSKSSSFASKYRARDAAPEKAFDPKASSHRRLETADDAFADDGEDACEHIARWVVESREPAD